MASDKKSVDPRKFPNVQFELFSIPAYDEGKPERILGSEIGSSKQILQPNDVLISRIVPHIRRAWIVPESNGLVQIGSSEWIVFRANDFNPNYLRYYLLSDQFNARFMSTVAGVGGSLLRARPATVAKLEISLPGIDEQKRIAAIIGKAEQIEKATLRTQEIRTELISATFLEMFGDPIVNPNNFDIIKLESLTKFHKQGLYFNQGYSNSGNQLIRIADMQKDGSLNFGTMPFVEIDSKTQEQFSVEIGDFLFARSGSIGTCAIVREKTDAVFGSFIIKFQFVEDLLNDYFIHYYQLPQIKRMMQSMSHGTTNVNINAKNIKNLDVLLPPITLQKKFIEIVDSIKRLPECIELSSTNFASITQELLR